MQVFWSSLLQVKQKLSSGDKATLLKPKHMYKLVYALIVPLIVVGGLVYANRETKIESSTKPAPKPISVAEREAARKYWEATPEGIRYKKWEASAAGKKVYSGEARIRKQIDDFTPMEAVVTSLSLPPGSRLGFGVMAEIGGVEYILSFSPEKAEKSFLNFGNEFGQLPGVKVGDKLMIRSRVVSHAPKYAYPIISGELVEKDGKVIYKREPRKGGC